MPTRTILDLIDDAESQLEELREAIRRGEDVNRRIDNLRAHMAHLRQKIERSRMEPFPRPGTKQ